MRLTRAGIALLVFLLIVCPLASVISYAALSGTAIGPIGRRATAIPTQVALATATRLSPGSSAAPTTTAPSSGTPTPTRNLGVVPLSPSPGPASPTTQAGNPSGNATPVTPTIQAGQSITVAYDTYVPYFPVRIAETAGYYGKRGLKVKQVPFGLKGNEYNEEARRAALRNGDFDILLTTLDAVALFGDDRTGKVIAIVDESAGADKIVARAPIQRLNDLKGKRIAFSSGSVAEFYLYATLNLVGLKATDVQPKPAESVDAAVDLFLSNQADAVVAWEPVVQRAIDGGGKAILGSDNYRAILDVAVASNKALTEKPAAVQAFLDSWFEAVKLTTDEPKMAGDVVVKSGDSDWTGVSKPADFTDGLALVAQATLGQNAFALRDASLLGPRLREIQTIWRSGGKTIADVDPARLLDGTFVQKSAAQGALNSQQAPINASFVLTSRIALPQLTPDQVGRTQPVAELPLKQIAFEPNSAVLTDQGRKDLQEQIVPILKQTPGLYLRVEGSAAQPLGDTPEENERFARARAQAVIFFLIGQGIDANRMIEGYLKPTHPGSAVEAELAQDRKVVFTLVQPGGR